MSSFLERVYGKAALCRAFEEECFRRLQAGEIKCPTYLSAGQEYIPATIATWLEDQAPRFADRKIFIQHRGHSHYLCFDGSMEQLVLELLGDKRGCAGGMGGSASIHSPEAGIVGHDGLMGSQVPIGVGWCFAARRPTIVFAGDAAIEEDYALAALGWAATHRLPILFVVEDNGLSILTKKEVRRSWGIVTVARAFGMQAYECDDDPDEIARMLYDSFNGPRLINVRTARLWWHAGAGKDLPSGEDRHRLVSAQFSVEYEHGVRAQAEARVAAAWGRRPQREAA